MTRKQYCLALVVLATAGLLGGLLSNWLWSTPAVADTSKMLTLNELRLVDEVGRTRALLSLLRGRPRLILSDQNGEFRLELGLEVDDQPEIVLRDQNGKARARFCLNGQGGPELSLSDNAGRRRATLDLGRTGAPALILRDDLGQDRLAVWQEANEMGVALADGSGNPRAGLILGQDDTPSLAFYGPDRKVVWAAPGR